MDAISTFKFFLMMKNSAAYEKLVDIKDFPDLGGEPEMLDKTTLSDKARTYIPGIQENESLAYTTNYNKADYGRLMALRGEEHDYAVYAGGTESGGVVTPTGTDGQWKFKGYLDVYTNGGGVNEVVDMTIVIAPSTPIDDSYMAE